MASLACWRLGNVDSSVQRALLGRGDVAAGTVFPIRSVIDRVLLRGVSGGDGGRVGLRRNTSRQGERVHADAGVVGPGNLVAGVAILNARRRSAARQRDVEVLWHGFPFGS